MKRLSAGLGLLVSFCLYSCASTSGSTSSGNPADGGTSAEGGAVDRGPRTLPFEGDPNGLYWDDSQQTLYVADDNGNRILRWTDAAGFSLVAELPAASPQGAGLGQVVRTSDGTLVVTRFGGGSAGDVVFVPPGGEPKVVPGLDRERRRIGLTVASDGQLYDSWFLRLSTGDRAGSIGQLALSGAEPEVLTGLKKPIGVLAVGADLFVSDQELGQVLKAPRSNPKAFTVLATVASPDLLAAGPDGSLFTGSAGGNLYRIAASGAASVFQSGFQQVRGVAYDPGHRRVFVADHDADESNGVSHVLHVLPVD
jgi:DNA-binding beta-propeller fold protein YncE